MLDGTLDNVVCPHTQLPEPVLIWTRNGSGFDLWYHINTKDVEKCVALQEITFKDAVCRSRSAISWLQKF